MKYMLLIQGPKSARDEFSAMPSEDREAHADFMRALNDELRESGELVDVQALVGSEEAKVVRARDSGPPAVTDGPFPEAKEFLAGYWIVDVEGPERAVEIAARASGAPGRNGAPVKNSIEVRQVMSVPGAET